MSKPAIDPLNYQAPRKEFWDFGFTRSEWIWIVVCIIMMVVGLWFFWNGVLFPHPLPPPAVTSVSVADLYNATAVI